MSSSYVASTLVPVSFGPIRPRFSFSVDATPDDAVAQLERAVLESGGIWVSRTLGEHVDVTVGRARRHRWSPCMQLEFSAGEAGTTVHGFLGPHPNVWTLFAFAYLGIATGTMFATIFGFVQMILEEQAWAFWALPIGALAAGGMYLVSQLGQRLAAEQTEGLYRLIAETFDTDVR